MALASCCNQAGGRFMQHSSEPCSRLSAIWPACRIQVPRRPAVQCDRVTVQSTVVCSVGSAFLSSGSTMGKVWKADEHPAIVSASGADSSTDYKPVANRKQLDQLFETLSTEHSIVTAQCLSHAAYQDFEAQIRRRGADSKAIGCCYFAGEGAACLAVNGCVDLIFGSFDHDDWDDMATRKVADIIYDAALACNLPIQMDKDDEYDPELKIIGFDPAEFANWRDGCNWEEELNEDDILSFFLMYKKYKSPNCVRLTFD